MYSLNIKRVYIKTSVLKVFIFKGKIRWSSFGKIIHLTFFLTIIKFSLTNRKFFGF
jgi:hypothetical protein